MNNFLSSAASSPSDDSVQAGLAKRSEILNTPLPDQIVCRIRGRSRVRVKSVGDLKLHMEVIEHLIDNYKDYPDHEHAICELFVISIATLHEWRRVYKKAIKLAPFHDTIARSFEDDSMPMRDLKRAVNDALDVFAS